MQELSPERRELLELLLNREKGPKKEGSPKNEKKKERPSEEPNWREGNGNGNSHGHNQGPNGYNQGPNGYNSQQGPHQGFNGQQGPHQGFNGQQGPFGFQGFGGNPFGQQFMNNGFPNMNHGFSNMNNGMPNMFQGMFYDFFQGLFQDMFMNMFQNMSQGFPQNGFPQQPPNFFQNQGPGMEQLNYFFQNMFQGPWNQAQQANEQTTDSRKNGAAQEGPASSPLIKMKSGSKEPFFCVHAFLGSTFHFYRLANLLDADQPFYALQAQGLDGSQPPLENIEAMAQLYLEEIRKVKPHGPYRLGGYSMGGLIAFEMARQLEALGEKVELLALIGTPVPFSISHPFVTIPTGFTHDYRKDFQKTFVEPFMSQEQRIKMNENGGGMEGNTALAKLFQAHSEAVLAYKPTPYQGQAVLFETVELQVCYPLDISRGWNHIVLGGVDTQVIPGNHLSVLDEPHVGHFAGKLSSYLNQTS